GGRHLGRVEHPRVGAGQFPASRELPVLDLSKRLPCPLAVAAVVVTELPADLVREHGGGYPPSDEREGHNEHEHVRRSSPLLVALPFLSLGGGARVPEPPHEP